MPKQIVNSKTLAIIQLAWEYQIPAKITAKALNLKYPLVTLYYRGFKSTNFHSICPIRPTGQLPAKQIIATLLKQNQAISPTEADQIIQSFIND